jgi:hypothetical protein
MRASIFGFGLVSLLAFGAPAEARSDAPWCAFLNSSGGFDECLYYTIDQCRATVSGVGGYCYENRFYVPPPEPARPRKAKRRH